jgi:isopentenyl phosphate kinase
MVRLAMESSHGDLPNISRAVMCMDVDGFYDSYDSPQRRLIDRIDDHFYHSNIKKWKEEKRTRTSKGDVSGGVLGKVISCHRISSFGTESYMIGGDLRSTLSSVLSGGGGGTVFPTFEGGPDCVAGKCG